MRLSRAPGAAAGVAGLSGVARLADWSLLRRCFFWVPAHPPEAEFADWFHSLKEPGTEGMPGGSVSCCSPERDCQITDYATDADGRYWITADGERVQVPPDKILQRTDNPTGRGSPACATTTGTRSCAVSSEPPKAKETQRHNDH